MKPLATGAQTLPGWLAVIIVGSLAFALDPDSWHRIIDTIATSQQLIITIGR